MLFRYGECIGRSIHAILNGYVLTILDMIPFVINKTLGLRTHQNSYIESILINIQNKCKAGETLTISFDIQLYLYSSMH